MKEKQWKKAAIRCARFADGNRRVLFLSQEERAWFRASLAHCYNELNQFDKAREYAKWYLHSPMSGFSHILALVNCSITFFYTGEIDTAEQIVEYAISLLEAYPVTEHEREDIESTRHYLLFRKGIMLASRSDREYKPYLQAFYEYHGSRSVADAEQDTIFAEMTIAAALCAGDPTYAKEHCHRLDDTNVWRMIADMQYDLHHNRDLRHHVKSASSIATTWRGHREPHKALFFIWNAAMLFLAAGYFHKAVRMCKRFETVMGTYCVLDPALENLVASIMTRAQEALASADKKGEA